jgi:hypothetical protein
MERSGISGVLAGMRTTNVKTPPMEVRTRNHSGFTFEPSKLSTSAATNTAPITGRTRWPVTPASTPPPRPQGERVRRLLARADPSRPGHPGGAPARREHPGHSAAGIPPASPGPAPGRIHRVRRALRSRPGGPARRPAPPAPTPRPRASANTCGRASFRSPPTCSQTPGPLPATLIPQEPRLASVRKIYRT